MESMTIQSQVSTALAELLPAMVVDGGGAEIDEIRAGHLTVRLVGSCLICPSAKLSAEALERGLRARVPQLTSIRIISGTRELCRTS
jgi:Fe-S cluster biogenesis protein NfuA